MCLKVLIYIWIKIFKDFKQAGPKSLSLSLQIMILENTFVSEVIDD